MAIFCLKAHAKGMVQKHRANVEIYLNKSIGIGEHSDIIQTVIKELEQVAKYEELLNTLENHFKKEEVYIDEIK